MPPTINKFSQNGINFIRETQANGTVTVYADPSLLPPPSTPPTTVIPLETFRRLITDAEWGLIYTQQKTDVMVEMFLDDLASKISRGVDLTDPRLAQGLNYGVTTGIFASSTRVTAILSNTSPS